MYSKRGEKLAQDVNGPARKQHSNGQGRSERDVETGAGADDGEQAWQEHIRRCSEYRKMVAERDNQPVRGGKGETKGRTAGVDHTWRPGVVQPKSAIGNRLCQPLSNYYQILVDEPPQLTEQPTMERGVAAQTAI